MKIRSFKNKVLCYFVSLVTISVSFRAVAQEEIKKEIAQLTHDDNLKHASLSFHVVDVKSGKEIAQYDSHRSLVPASSLKTVTTATALSVLGKNYRFKTELQYTGVIDSLGVLHGDLYIKGYGDPTLGSPFMEGVLSIDSLFSKWAAKIDSIGIKHVDGRIIGDPTFFQKELVVQSWQWNDIGNYYGAGSSGLNIHENLYFIHFKQTSKIGEQPKIVKTVPAIPYVSINNEVICAGKSTGDQAYVYGAPYSNVCFVRGTIPIGVGIFDKTKAAILDPALFVAYKLNEVLQQRGVKTNNDVVNYYFSMFDGSKASTKRIVIDTQYSPPLYKIVTRANQESINLYCETLLKMLGKSQRDKGTTEAGIEALEEYWSKKGVDLTGFFMEDGSGLSSRNAISSSQFTTILRKTAQNDSIGSAFLNSLAVAGKSGTMKNMLRKTLAEGKVLAKSGTLKRVKSYTGYALTQSGKLVAFSFIVNNFEGSSYAVRKKLEKLMLALAKIS